MSRLLFITTILATFSLFSCSNEQEKVKESVEKAAASVETATELPFKISLAQWSLNKQYREDGVDPYLFSVHAKELGFSGVEYVSQLYKSDLEEGAGHGASVANVVSKLDSVAKANGMDEVLIMIDREGDLASPDEAKRSSALQNHKHWVDGAWASGIPTIRVNLSGEGSKIDMMKAAVSSLKDLGAYAKPKNVNVVVENHGGFSSDPVWLRDVMAEVNMNNVGILPDFGNFCRKGTWDEKTKTRNCTDEVPNDSIYTAVGMWMPYAHAVSAKSYNFDDSGEETKINFARMLDTVRAHGYNGYVGVEFEGFGVSPEQGIAATKALIEKN